MKLYSFEVNHQGRVGAELDGQLVDLAAGYNALLSSREPKPGALRAMPTEMLSFVRLGQLAMDAAAETIRFLKKRPAVPVGEQLVYPFDAVNLQAPIVRPGKILCVGGNDRHQISIPPEEPFFFGRFPSAVIGPGASIVKPPGIKLMRFGVELAVVIGKPTRGATESEVMGSIFGFTLLNGISTPDMRVENRVTLGPNFDTFCPIGPCIVTADDLKTPENIGLRCSLNGQLLQEVTTANWLFQLPRLLSFLSSIVGLEPGDIVSTGTPGIENTPVFLNEGDVITGNAGEIGELRNPVTSKG